MNRVLPQGEVRQRIPSERFTPQEKRYYKWLHEGGGECCLTAQPKFEIAHTGKKHGPMKAPLNTCLPIIRGLHIIEERMRLIFWEQVGFPDYLDWAERLHDCHIEGGHPMDVLQEMQRQADRTIIADMLTDPNGFCRSLTPQGADT